MARRPKNSGTQDKRRRIQSHGRRAENLRSQRLLFIIACEGIKTERFYFEAWFRLLIDRRQLSPTSCVIAKHEHTDPTGVLEDLKSFSNGYMTYKDFQHRWIIIDRDEERTGGGGHTLDSFNAALNRAMADKSRIEVAWSNPCFEIWYLLHFDFYNSAMDRDTACSKLVQRVASGYKKNDPEMFAKLNYLLPDAMRNAKRLHEEFQACHSAPSNSNPCTTVYKLVGVLKDLLREE